MKNIIKKLVTFAKDKKKDKKNKTKQHEVEEASSEEEVKQEGGAANLIQQLMEAEPESRTILFHGELNEEKSAEVIAGIIGLTKIKAPKQDLKEGEMPYDPITLYISTYGGNADEMFGIFDLLQEAQKKCVVETIGNGKVMSAGTLMLAGGTKGHRKIYKNCRVMLHQVSAGAVGPLFNIASEVEEIQQLQDKYINCLVSCTNLSKRKLKSLLNERVNVYLSAEEAVEYGLADEII
jgi:ATP-dependent Clp endopeptidase proteolytic subunit ClpP